VGRVGETEAENRDADADAVEEATTDSDEDKAPDTDGDPEVLADARGVADAEVESVGVRVEEPHDETDAEELIVGVEVSDTDDDGVRETVELAESDMEPERVRATVELRDDDGDDDGHAAFDGDRLEGDDDGVAPPSTRLNVARCVPSIELSGDADWGEGDAVKDRAAEGSVREAHADTVGDLHDVADLVNDLTEDDLRLISAVRDSVFTEEEGEGEPFPNAPAMLAVARCVPLIEKSGDAVCAEGDAVTDCCTVGRVGEIDCVTVAHGEGEFEAISVITNVAERVSAGDADKDAVAS